MQPEKNQNIDWISSLRFIALYAVIVLHCTSLLLAQYGKVPMINWWIADFFNAGVRFAVPVFVMITGALLLHREYEPVTFLRKRLSRVVIPFLFWSLVYVWYSLHNEELIFGTGAWTNLKLVLHQLKYGASYHLWYVYMLIGLYFFIPVICKFVQHAGEREILYFLIVWFGVMLIAQPYLVRYNPSVDMHYFAGYAGYLVLGHYLTFKDFTFRHIRLWMAALFLFCVCLIAFGSYYIIPYPKIPGTMFFEPLNPAIVLLSSGMFLFVRYSPAIILPWAIKTRDFVGKYNYGIYLGHALVLYLIDDPAAFTGVDNSFLSRISISYKMCTPVIAIPATALICFVITFGLVWLINKIPLVGKWISG